MGSGRVLILDTARELTIAEDITLEQARPECFFFEAETLPLMSLADDRREILPSPTSAVRSVPGRENKRYRHFVVQVVMFNGEY